MNRPSNQQEWLDQVTEEIVDQDLEIIDPHIVELFSAMYFAHLGSRITNNVATKSIFVRVAVLLAYPIALILPPSRELAK